MKTELKDQEMKVNNNHLLHKATFTEKECHIKDHNYKENLLNYSPHYKTGFATQLWFYRIV